MRIKTLFVDESHKKVLDKTLHTYMEATDERGRRLVFQIGWVVRKMDVARILEARATIDDKINMLVNAVCDGFRVRQVRIKGRLCEKGPCER